MSTWGRRFEWVVFCLLCVVVASAPMVAHLLLLALPNAGGWLGSAWLNGIYVSWAFLIYFSWSFLPGIEDPFGERMRSWGWFFLFELAYPVLSWGLEGDSRVYLAADVSSYVSTCVSLAVTFLLLQAAFGEPSDGGGVLLALVATFFCILLPGVVGEVAWWQQVELPSGGWLGPMLRVGGVGLGVVGVVRNLQESDLF